MRELNILEALMGTEARILLLDIETAPKIVYAWGLFKQNIGINQIIEPGRTICWASKWLGEKKVTFRSEYHHGHDRMVEDAHAMMEQADLIITYNGKSFDMPTLYREFLLHGLTPPAPHDDIDLYQIVRSTFRFDSNKLDWVLKMLGLETKVNHKGMDLWTGCLNGNAEDWKVMKEYNMQDVRVMEPLYLKLLPWIRRHPNMALFRRKIEVETCYKCGSDDLQRRGTRNRAAGRYPRYRCNNCGSWQQGRFMLGEYRGNSNILKGAA